MSEEMKQIVAPPPRSGEDPLTPDQAKNLVTWLDAEGWCSCCRREDIAVAHYGNVDRSISFALCGGCIKRMAETLGWKGVPESFDAQRATDEITKLRSQLAEDRQRANDAADENGHLRRKEVTLLVENAELRREIDRLRRRSSQDRGTK